MEENLATLIRGNRMKKILYIIRYMTNHQRIIFIGPLGGGRVPTNGASVKNPYIVEDGVNGFLFNPESVDSMFESIKKMLNLTKNQREDMGTLNRRVCLERNTEEKFLKSYIDLIETL